MKKFIFGLICLTGFFSLAFAQKNSTQVPVIHLAKAEKTMKEKNNAPRVRMSLGKEEVIVEMFDNPASREFLSMLPLTMQFDDFASTEKIANLPRKLKSQGPLGKEVKGDFTYYAPWGNLAVFYKGFGSASGLYIMGRIVSGKETLAKMHAPFTATIEKIK